MRFDEPTDIDQAPDPQREDERIREERWTAFVKESRARIIGLYQGDVGMLLCDVIAAMDRVKLDEDPMPHERPYIDFAETEGWDGVLNAIARAMPRERAAARKETA